MNARRPRSVPRGPSVDRMEPRTLFDATVRTVSLANDLAYGTTPATAVAVDPYGDVYATRTGGDGTNHTELLVVPAGSSKPQVLTSFAPMIEYADTAETPFGEMVVNAAGDVFGVTRFTTVGEVPFGQDYTQGTLWELPAHFNTVDVIARFYKPQTAPRSLTVDAAGNLYGVVDSLLGQGSSVFAYPTDETGVVTVPLGADTYCAAIVVNPAGDVFGTLAPVDDPTGPFSLFKLAHGAAAATVLATVPAALGHDVAGLAVDASNDLFITTRQGTNGGAILELPAGSATVHLLAGYTGQAFNGKPAIDPAGNVFATADGAGNASVLYRRPVDGTALQTVATFATGRANRRLARRAGQRLRHLRRLDHKSGNCLRRLRSVDHAEPDADAARAGCRRVGSDGDPQRVPRDGSRRLQDGTGRNGVGDEYGHVGRDGDGHGCRLRRAGRVGRGDRHAAGHGRPSVDPAARRRPVMDRARAAGGAGGGHLHAAGRGDRRDRHRLGRHRRPDADRRRANRRARGHRHRHAHGRRRRVDHAHPRPDQQRHDQLNRPTDRRVFIVVRRNDTARHPAPDGDG